MNKTRMKEEKKRASSLLFVCYGNICRSPIAERLAKKMMGDKIRIESAGVAPSALSATNEAIQAMKSLYGIDISDHNSRDIKDVPYDQFDYVIVMDAFVYMHLLVNYKIPKEKLIQWNIEDPISQGLEMYKEVARKIQKNLKDFLHKMNKS